MFNAFSIITDSLALPSGTGTGRQLPEPVRRPSTAVQRSSSIRPPSISRPLSIVTDIVTPAGPGRSSTRPASAIGHRPRSMAAQRESIVNSTLKRSTTVIVESEAEAQPREQVYRWDGIIGARSEWDCIRRDHELWTPEGDALVHFYAQGQSRRGPSIRLAFDDIEQCNCARLLAESLVQGPSGWELYLPAPRRIDRNAAFQHHLTTRNLFAWMFDRPIVGSQLGPALIALHERLDAARDEPARNAQEMLAYIESQGYADFRNNPDHAAGILVYAERFQVAELWIDAFVHSAGQYEQLSECLDWPSVSLTTKALLARATCEMQVRLERASDELTSFMEGSMARIDLAEDVRRHLERFRSFLHGYYVQKLGYWPPEMQSNSLPKSTLHGMYSDFRSLYELLADMEPAQPDWGSITGSTTSGHSTTVKMDVPAIIRSYDRRYRYNSLPHTQPLVPTNIPPESDSFLSTLIPNFGAAKRARTGRRAAMVASLHQAMNAPTNPAAAASPLVREYRDFERTSTLQGDERISPAAARAGRWLLVYAMLQTLIDVTRAPAEVRDADGVSYPLCCQTAGTPPWSTTVQPEVVELDSVEAEVSPVAETAPSADALRVPSPAPSPVPSAKVAPLDLRAVANKRRSMVVGPSSGPPMLHAPKPRRPASSSALATLDATYSASVEAMATAEDHEAEKVAANDGSQASIISSSADDNPGLSPTSVRHSRHSSDGGTSDGTRSEPGEAHTPTSAGADGGSVFERYFNKDDDRLPQAPPSPSIYEDALSGGPNIGNSGSQFDLLGVINKPGSEELAARWRGEIGVVEGEFF